MADAWPHPSPTVALETLAHGELVDGSSSTPVNERHFPVDMNRTMLPYFADSRSASLAFNIIDSPNTCNR